MKTTIRNLRHLNGEKAYLIYWMEVYDCKVKLSSVMAINRNLEIIVDDEANLRAYRYDYPDEIKKMINFEIGWILHHPDSTSPKELLKFPGFN